MESKRTLTIELDELCQAMEDNSHENEYYLDLETGEILFLSDYIDDEEAERVRDGLEDNPDRYEQVPSVDSRKGYEDMEDFIATVEDEHLTELLEVAIDGRGAFRRFKDVLLNYPEERERWFQFKDERMRERALEWLDKIGVEVDEN